MPKSILSGIAVMMFCFILHATAGLVAAGDNVKVQNDTYSLVTPAYPKAISQVILKFFR